MWLIVGVMVMSAVAWFTLGNVYQKLNISVKINYQLAVICFSVLALIYYLILFQQQGDFLLDVNKGNVKRTLYARVGAKETGFQTIFKQGMMGYNTSRIPALVYHQDTFLAFCEARKDTSLDVGRMDIILRRGKREGMEVTWGDVQIVATSKGYRCMNPVPVVDKTIDVIILVFIQIPAYIDQSALLRNGVYNQQVLVTKSFDNGETWTLPEDITDSTIGRMNPPPALFATGPGHGIQMSSGRLVVPGNYFVKDEIGQLLHYLDNFEDTTNYANVIFSDDNGATWSMGGRMPFGVDPLWRPIHSGESMKTWITYINTTNHANVLVSDDSGDNWHMGGDIPFSTDLDMGRPIHSNEAMVVEIDKGQLVLNARTMHADLTRVQARSVDEGETFGVGDLVQELVEPGYKVSRNNTIPNKTGGCQASLVGFPAPFNEKQSDTWVLFSNPAMHKFRERMSIRISKDGCQTWSRPWTLHPLASGYSDLAYFETRDPVSKFNSQNFGIIFEGGKNYVYESIMFKMFNLEALERGLEIVKMQDKRPWDDTLLNQSDDVIHKKQRGQQAWLNLV